MATPAWLPVHPVLLAYLLAFGGAAVACFAVVPRALRIAHDGTRRGLVWLLLASGTWAAAHVAFLVLPTVRLDLAAYYVGLTVGFAAVGPWLYFCSAYTGRALHRSPTLRRAAVATFVVVMAVKFTNPLHGYYFRTMEVEMPFPHLTVVNGPAHWAAMGLAYALSAMGYFMLLELFREVGHDTTPLVALIGLSGLPVLLDVVGAASPLLLDITYEPLGFAAMAVGLLYVYVEDFQTVRMAGEGDDPVVVLGDDDRVRDYNAEAEGLFPALSVDEPLEAVAPEVAAHAEAAEAVVEVERRGGTRYFQLSANPFSTAAAGSGRLITLSDITERQQYRDRLERQNERLERFASVVSHDLRNPLNVAQGRIGLAKEDGEGDDLEAASEALDRMEVLIEDLLSLARQGQHISETETVALSTVVGDARSVVETDRASIELVEDRTLEADPDRLQQLLENLFRNAVEHGSTSPGSHAHQDAVEHGSTSPASHARQDAGEDGPTSPDSQAHQESDDHGRAEANDGDDGVPGGREVTVTVGALEDSGGFYVADDGPGIPSAERDDVLSFGYSTVQDGTGFGLAIVSEIAEAHGWDLEVTESSAGGARFEITGVAAGPDPGSTSAEPDIE
jgi:signal transduction histidine kinase